MDHARRFYRRGYSFLCPKGSSSTKRLSTLRWLALFLVATIFFRLFVLQFSQSPFVRTSTQHRRDHIHDRSLNCSNHHDIAERCTAGVPIKYLFRYNGYKDETGSVVFSCFDRKKSIPIESVNDNYCDCADGSDEPGTSSCAGTANPSTFKFACSGEVKSVFLSMVDDGLCDCCDGSDEIKSGVECPYHCEAPLEVPKEPHATASVVHVRSITVIIVTVLVFHIGCIGLIFYHSFKNDLPARKKQFKMLKV